MTSATLNMLPVMDSETEEPFTLSVVMKMISMTMPVAMITGRKYRARKNRRPRKRWLRIRARKRLTSRIMGREYRKEPTVPLSSST